MPKKEKSEYRTGMHPNSIAARKETEFKEGHDAAGPGRPKGSKSLRQALKRALEAPVDPKDPDGPTEFDTLMGILRDKAKTSTRALLGLLAWYDPATQKVKAEGELNISVQDSFEKEEPEE